MVCLRRFKLLECFLLKDVLRRDGPDGPWASFYINVGDADASGHGQNFRAFPSLSLSVLVLPLAADFCNGSHLLDLVCQARNTIYQSKIQAWEPSLSKTWTAHGEIDMLSASSLSNLVSNNRTTTAQPYGVDNVGLGETSTQSPIQMDQWVAGLASTSFFMALFGLSNVPFQQGASFLTSFRFNQAIPGTSLSYTAGCYARDWRPSLVLGGYDSARFDPSTTLEIDVQDATVFPGLGQLRVNVTAIIIAVDRDVGEHNFVVFNPQDHPQDLPTFNGYSLTLNIDPFTPQIWLPRSACDVFEEAFHLEWDDISQLYLLNSSIHDRLIRSNQSVTFSLNSSRSNGAIKNITLYYRTIFDLNVTYPLVESWNYYFPLKRASNPHQYILGRAFLQEAHISVDYDNGYFNLSQAKSDGSQPDIVAIGPSTTKSFGPPTTKPFGPPTTKSSRLSTGAYAGIGVGIGILAIAMGLLFLSWKRMWWSFKKTGSHNASELHYEKPELHHDAVPRVEAMEKERAELETKEPRHEMTSSDSHRQKITDLNELHELDASVHDHDMPERRD